MDFSMTTRDAILWNIKCLRFESLNGTKKRCLQSADVVLVQYLKVTAF